MTTKFFTSPITPLVTTLSTSSTAESRFNNPLAITLFDEKNSTIDEDRWITLGCVNGNHYLVVVHTYKNENGLTATIRVISARTASKNEIQQYQIG